MKPILAIILFWAAFPLTSSAQNQADTTQLVYAVVEHMPQYPGGNDSMMKFINSHWSIHYPTDKKAPKMPYLVEVVVESNGALSHLKSTAAIEPEIAAEAFRIIELMPKWLPGTQLGKPVRVKYFIPFWLK